MSKPAVPLQFSNRTDVGDDRDIFRKNKILKWNKQSSFFKSVFLACQDTCVYLFLRVEPWDEWVRGGSDLLGVESKLTVWMAGVGLKKTNKQKNNDTRELLCGRSITPISFSVTQLERDASPARWLLPSFFCREVSLHLNGDGVRYFTVFLSCVFVCV